MVALIGMAQAVVVLVLGSKLSGKIKAVGKDALAARSQVENGHTTNLREEGDARHNQNGAKLDSILSEVTRLRESVGRLWQRTDKHTDQIHELEHTQPPSRFEPPRARHRGETP